MVTGFTLSMRRIVIRERGEKRLENSKSRIVSREWRVVTTLYSPLSSCIITPMIELNIPGRGTLQLEHLVCDVSGTLAVDGQLPEGLSRLIRNLRDRLTVHLITADTHGRQLSIDQQLRSEEHTSESSHQLISYAVFCLKKKKKQKKTNKRQNKKGKTRRTTGPERGK